MKGLSVPPIYAFYLRVVVGLGIAVVMARFFFGHIGLVSVGGLAIFLVGMAYVTEYFRNRKSQ